MTKYHINPETGVPGSCEAKIQCPFGGAEAHFNSPEEARAAFEANMAGETLQSSMKKTNSATAWVETKPCMFCGNSSKLEVNRTGLADFKNGAFAQDAFPELAAEERELLISGTHAHCWEGAFGGAEE